MRSSNPTSPIGARAHLVVGLAVVLACVGCRSGGAYGAYAPGPDERAAVLDVVQRAFDALAADDRALWDDLLIDAGHLVSVGGAPGARRVQSISFDDFLASVGSREVGVLERMWDPVVLVDGDVALVWTPYDVHVDGGFSHCGIDAITLVRTDVGWRLASVVWSVERESCEPSPLGPPHDA